MTHTVLSRRHGHVEVLLIDNPPVNAISNAVADRLAQALAAAIGNPDVHAIVVMGAGRTFIAGADIAALQRLAWGDDREAPDFHALLAQIEDAGKPVVMAIHGTALGGGLEVAMAGHFRLAAPSAQMGQPEVNLGLIPGAEGTQRLPRLVGVEKALEMCISGRPIGAAEAVRLGLVDQIVEGDLETDAVRFAREALARGAELRKTRDRADTIPSADALPPMLAAGRDLATRTRRGQHAPLAVVDAVQAAATLPFTEGCAEERRLFLGCVRSDQGKALIHVFFAERGVSKVPGIGKDAAVLPVATVGIVGAGTMGGGIAMACANAGLSVRLSDNDQPALDRGMATIRRNYEVSVTRGRFTADAVAERLARIAPQVGLGGFDDVDLIIEAVFENLALKKQVMSALDAVARPGCLLATNTSTLDIDEIAGVTRRPESVLGLHFFSPANVMRLVEIVRGRNTSGGTIASAQAVARRLGKIGVVVGNCPGFVGNRLMFPYLYEAQFLVEDGATPEQVDRVLTDFGMAMGVFGVDDVVGLDVMWRIRQELGQFAEPGVRRPLVVERLCELGRFGQKAGRGWYAYGPDRKPTPDPEVLTIIEQTARASGITRRPHAAGEILERTLYALINEGARVLEEGFALRAADIDIVYINGYGFPAHRGGPMFYADLIGLPRILDRVSAFHQTLGSRWAPAPLLTRLAREGKTFHEHDVARGVAPSR